MKKIAVLNQKGGVGKTVTVLNLSHGLAMQGFTTLMIDGDPQSTLSGILLQEDTDETIYPVLKGDIPARECIQEVRENLFLLPSDPRLARFDGVTGILKDKLKDVKTFDYIILDGMPSLGYLTAEYLRYVDHALIPVKTDYLSLRGLLKVLDLIFIIQEERGVNLSILGYLPCQYDARRVLDRDVLEILKKRFKKDVFKPIRQNVSIAVSPSWGETIFEYQKNSYGAADYKRLVKEVIKRTGGGKHG